MRSLLLLLLFLSLLLAGCGKKEVIKPEKLTRITNEVKLSRAWSKNIGGSGKKKTVRFVPDIVGDAIFAVSVDGVVRKLDKDNGKLIWKIKTGEDISGGLTASKEQVIISSTNGEVIALSAEDGTEMWRQQVSSEVLSPVAINYRRVFVQSADDKVYALDKETGQKKWIYEAVSPVLSLRGNSKPLLIENWVVAGFSNGKLVAIDVATGSEVWSRRVGSPTGRSELERIVDVDGDFIFNGQQLYAASYQGSVIALDLQNSRQLWQREVSSNVNLAGSYGNIYVVDASGTISALDEMSGEVQWEQKAFRARKLSSPVVFGSHLLVGDLDGYVHVLSLLDGHQQGRKRVDRDPFMHTMIVDENYIFVSTQDGSLTALSLQER